MLPEPRRFQNETDLPHMLALLQAGRAAGLPTYYVHPGDLLWWLYYPPLGLSFWQSIYLWDDPRASSELLGWALLAPDGETFDVYYRPDLHDTEQAGMMLAWAENEAEKLARAAGCERIGMFWVVPDDHFRAGWLEGRSYRVSGADAALSRSLKAPVDAGQLPPGFEVRSCRGLHEVESRARAQYGAFGSSAPFNIYTQRFSRFMQSPAYQPDHDIVSVAPGGHIAAFCFFWTDDFNRVGLLEPVGTHPAFQRMGLGKAIILEALRRLQAKGMRKVIVCTPQDNAPAIGLYRSAGFDQHTVFQLYQKDLQPSGTAAPLDSA